MMKLPTASILADLSQIIYRQTGSDGAKEGTSEFRSRIISDLESMGMSDITVVDYDDVQATVSVLDGVRITCYRGTDSAAEMVTNFLARVDPDPIVPRVRVHAKWSEDVETVMHRLEGRVDYFDGMFDIFTGHSRGGAAAQIHAARISHLKQVQRIRTAKPICVSHESPRPGTAGFAKFMRDNVNHIRWQRAGDIVPATPVISLNNPPAVFMHDVRPHYFDHDGVLRNRIGWMTRISGFLKAVAHHVSIPGFAGFALHSMSDLAKLIKKEESESSGNLLRELL